jgi:hypothetical protein
MQAGVIGNHTESDSAKTIRGVALHTLGFRVVLPSGLRAELPRTRCPKPMSQLGKMLLIGGCIVAGFGVLLIVGDHFGLGRLPGDLVWKRKQTTLYFPWVTSLVVSIILTLLLNLFLRRK